MELQARKESFSVVKRYLW